MQKNKELFEEAVQRINATRGLSEIHKETAFTLLQGCDPNNVKPGIDVAFRYIKFVMSPQYTKTSGYEKSSIKLNRPSVNVAKSV